MARSGWRGTEVVAWTAHDGPAPAPPVAPLWLWVAPAVAVTAALGVVLFTDSLCPEHRAWVQSLALVAIVGAITATVGLVRGWASAPLLTWFSSALGIGIGLIDTAHAPLRGAFVAGGFGLAFVLSAVLVLRQRPAAAWDRRLGQAMQPVEVAAAPAPSSAHEIVDRADESLVSE